MPSAASLIESDNRKRCQVTPTIANKAGLATGDFLAFDLARFLEL